MEKIEDDKTYGIIGAAMKVHSTLKSGFLEAVYQDALEVEFKKLNIPFKREVEIPVFYDGVKLNSRYRADYICFDNIIVELKALKNITNIEEAQLINYLKATNYRLGLLINFGEKSLVYKRFSL
ncbi:MAG: GxxExxY protein [Spirochaetia bacterium]|nr:GxxExxY protein [Spirochaetia bacterium]MDY4985233.1 GxxExxY protein [Treponema sp.]